MTIDAARLELQRARVLFHLARVRYLLAVQRVESKIYRTDRPALLRPQI